METFFPFFLVIFAGVVFSVVFRRFHVPWVVALIVGGMIIGPHGINIFHSNETIDFIAELGLVFLMFMAGLETNLSSLKDDEKSILTISVLNGAIPFFVGMGLGLMLGFTLISAIFLGIIFVSSSVAVIIPTLERHNLLDKRIGKTIVASTIIEDVVSLILLSILLQILTPSTSLPLPLFYAFLFISLFVLRSLIPKAQKIFSGKIRKTDDFFQQEFRAVFVILIGTVLLFELLGLHPIIAGFFAGLVLSGTVRTKAMEDKLKVISYGIFIPTFFIIIGVKADLSIFTNIEGVIALTLAIVLGSMTAKFLSGFIGGRFTGFKRPESALIGISTMPQLSTTLAVVFTGIETGLLPQELLTAMLVLTIVSVFVAPLLTKPIVNRMDKEPINTTLV